MTIVDQYRGKSILITGTTGFLGKVLLEKFLFSLPQIEVIYILIRRKKGLDLNERFKKEVISSACFDRIRNQYGNSFD
jgi:fatty acyl-CoA reductase